MRRKEKVIHRQQTAGGQYEVIEMEYEGRRARVLFSGDKVAAQSGIPLDESPDLLFDYNQRFMEIAESLKPKRVLLIGGGALTFPVALAKIFPSSQIDVVEPNPDLPALAERFFGFDPNTEIQIYTDDGYHFLTTTQERYDLIYVDAFRDTEIPASLKSSRAVEQFKQHLRPGGAVAMNIISAYYGRNAAPIQKHYERFTHSFKRVAVFPASRSLLSFWLPQNFVLVARDRSEPSLAVRFEALEPPVDV